MEIQKIEFNPTLKQAFAYLKLVDSETREIGYGGSAGSIIWSLS